MTEHQYERLRANHRVPRAAILLAGGPERALLSQWAETARRRQRLIDALAPAAGRAVDLDAVDLELGGARLRIRTRKRDCAAALQARRTVILRALKRSGVMIQALDIVLEREGRP